MLSNHLQNKPAMGSNYILEYISLLQNDFKSNKWIYNVNNVFWRRFNFKNQN